MNKIEKRLREIADEHGIKYDPDMSFAEFCLAVETKKTIEPRYNPDGSLDFVQMMVENPGIVKKTLDDIENKILDVIVTKQ